MFLRSITFPSLKYGINNKMVLNLLSYRRGTFSLNCLTPLRYSTYPKKITLVCPFKPIAFNNNFLCFVAQKKTR